MRVRAIITSVDVNVYDGRADMRNARPFSQIIVSRRHYRRFTFSRDADVIWPQNLTLVAPKCADVFFESGAAGDLLYTMVINFDHQIQFLMVHN